MKLSKKLGQIIFSLVFTTNIGLSAESFRVSKVSVASITQDTTSEAYVSLGINEALAIYLPEDQTFIEGLELKFDIPDSVAYWMDSVACSIYSNIKPNPSSTQIDYSGTRAYVSTLPGKLSWVLQIPLKDDNSIKSNNYTTKVDTVINPTNNAVFIRLQPVMKGIPEETLNSKIPVTIKPILSKKGQLELNITSSDGNLQPYTVFIDDKIETIPANNKLLLDTGVHNLSVISEAYRNEIRTIRIEMASTTPLSIVMRSIEPTLLITAPEGTTILLDDEKCTTIGKEFVISEGEHKIKFSIGNYEMIRTITAVKGKSYTANFSLDLQITED